MKKSATIDAPPSHLYETENDLSLEQRKNMIRLLNQRLATAIDLQMQLKHAHWNVKGPNFMSLHELFDTIAEMVEGYLDNIAERIVQLAGIARGTVRSSAAESELPEYPLALADGSAHVEVVARVLSAFGSESRKMIIEAKMLEDAVSSDLFTEVTRGLDKVLWFVEAHSQASK